MSHIKRFLTCHRGVVALESALAIIPLMLCLTGVFQIVQTLFADDLLQRAAHRVARANANTMASDAADMESRVRHAIDSEIGDWLSYELMMNADCPQPSEDEGNHLTEYCLSATLHVYDSPLDMPSGTLSQGDDAALGGGSRDMVVVRLRLQPRSVLGEVQQTLFGETGLRAVAVMRNECRDNECGLTA